MFGLQFHQSTLLRGQVVLDIKVHLHQVVAVVAVVAQVVTVRTLIAKMVVLVALVFNYLQYFVILPILMEHLGPVLVLLDQVDQPSG